MRASLARTGGLVPSSSTRRARTSISFRSRLKTERTTAARSTGARRSSSGRLNVFRSRVTSRMRLMPAATGPRCSFRRPIPWSAVATAVSSPAPLSASSVADRLSISSFASSSPASTYVSGLLISCATLAATVPMARTRSSWMMRVCRRRASVTSVQMPIAPARSPAAFHAGPIHTSSIVFRTSTEYDTVCPASARRTFSTTTGSSLYASNSERPIIPPFSPERAACKAPSAAVTTPAASIMKRRTGAW